MARASHFLFFIFLILASSPFSFAADAVEIGFDGKPNKKGVPAKWELKEKAGDADFEVTKDGPDIALHVKSKDASFSFQSEIRINANEYPYATWTWKAVALPPHGDIRKSSRNDQALQVMIAFKDKKILSYVWDSNAPEGTVSEESVPWPISLKIKVIAVKSGAGDLGKWVTITRNIREDFKKLFKEDPPAIEGVRVQTNTQHTESFAEGYFKKIVFSKKPI